METQIQVTDSFKMELSSNFSPAIFLHLTSMKLTQVTHLCDEFEVNEMPRGQKWNNNYKQGGYSNNQNYSNNSRYNNKTQNNKLGNKWEQKERDLRITLLHLISFQQSLVSHFSDNLISNATEKRRAEEAR